MNKTRPASRKIYRRWSATPKDRIRCSWPIPMPFRVLIRLRPGIFPGTAATNPMYSIPSMMDWQTRRPRRTRCSIPGRTTKPWPGKAKTVAGQNCSIHQRRCRPQTRLSRRAWRGSDNCSGQARQLLRQPPPHQMIKYFLSWGCRRMSNRASLRKIRWARRSLR